MDNAEHRGVVFSRASYYPPWLHEFSLYLNF